MCIRDRPSVDVCEQGAEPAEFWAALGGQGPVAAATADAAKDNPARGVAKLYKVSDASGTLQTTPVGAGGKLERAMLTSDAVFLMDNAAELFVWVGKGASADERRRGMALGQEFCAQGGRPKATRLTKVMEGAEPVMFTSNFAAVSYTHLTLPTICSV